MFFAWFANMAMHIGMADMSIFRYARKWYHGFASAAGMFVGHFLAWLASGILFAAAATDSVAPGPIAYMAVGVAGAVCVVIAGWTTANPTLYRAGLALNVITPGWSRWKVTLLAGAVTSIAALSPALVMQLLDFVALYGLILMPMGAIIFTDYYLIPKLGMRREYAEWSKTLFSWPAAITWVLTLAISFMIPVEIFFKALPGWFIACGLYLLLSKLTQKKEVA
jgi:cytosine permease